MISLTIIISIVYLLLVIWLLIGWERGDEFELDKNLSDDLNVSIIVPVRNESENILNLINDIKRQTYSTSLLELIIVDDFSTDGTVDIVRDESINSALAIYLIKLPSEWANQSNKKRAIDLAIKQCKGDMIVTTDGDCRVGENWIKTIVQYKKKSNARFISSPVSITSNGSVWEGIQQIEFSSLIGSGAACIHWGRPTMCNGANIAYEKKLFYEMRGFEGNESIPSGDDEFLMHKVHKSYPGQVHFLKSAEAVVSTLPQENIAGFINQRVRWAGKWSHYQTFTPQILAFFVFIFNFSLLANFILLLSGLFPGMLFLVQLILKILAEFVFLRRVSDLSQNRIKLIPFILLELVYPIYVVVVALAGFRGQYKWKERIIKN